MAVALLEREFGIPTEGDRYILSPSQLKRFLSPEKVRKQVVIPEYGECWQWVGAQNGKGYGRFYLEKRDGKPFIAYSHVTSYSHFVGPIPYRWVIDHMCGIHSCMRPDHLEAIPNQVNLRRADARRPWKRRNQYSKE